MTAINREYIYSVSLKIFNVIYLKWITKSFVYKLVMVWGVLFYYPMYEYLLKTLIWHINKCFDTAYFDLVNKTLIKSFMVAVGMGYGGSPFPDTAYPVPDVYMRHLSNMINFGILFVHLSTSLGCFSPRTFFFEQRRVSGFATGSHCNVWSRGCTTFLLYDSPHWGLCLCNDSLCIILV